MHQGSCLCGAIKYRVDDDLNSIVNCHCQYCRKAHGAEFIPIAIIPQSSLVITQGSELVSKYEVEAVNAFRCFCCQCGTRLYNHSPTFEMMTLITATLNDATNLKPIANINMESSNPNFVQFNNLPFFEALAEMSELRELKN
ncbi:MAG: aldehyde-activating protein [SAR86 cluster bacterium]|uniref:Aldehyde-activating protein n=1 Tax=SAR86 cluster bacterium TaxID=2030880 RepID=A0A2A4MQD6_9GAMM|nr:MAG: aldehyde-activating protein [SAR86 cluster bacterium]